MERVAERVLEVLAEREAEPSWPEWMGVETAGRYLDMSPSRLHKLVSRREIPYSQEGKGCRVFFERRRLDEWMRAQG